MGDLVRTWKIQTPPAPPTIRESNQRDRL